MPGEVMENEKLVEGWRIVIHLTWFIKPVADAWSCLVSLPLPRLSAEDASEEAKTRVRQRREPDEGRM